MFVHFDTLLGGRRDHLTLTNSLDTALRSVYNTMRLHAAFRIILHVPHKQDCKHIGSLHTRARARFPEDVERYFIQKHDPSGIPVAILGVAIDPSMADYYSLIEKKVILPISRIDGVANVELNGLLIV